MILLYYSQFTIFWQIVKNYGTRSKNTILGPLFEGAVCEADWGSVLYCARHSLRQKSEIFATSLKEGGKKTRQAVPTFSFVFIIARHTPNRKRCILFGKYTEYTLFFIHYSFCTRGFLHKYWEFP